MRLGGATPLEDILEADWQRDVVQLARTLGWLPYHTFNAKGSAHGFPDLVFVRDRVVFVEFKREKTNPTDKQKTWIRSLLKAGAEAYIARPRDLSTIGVILAHRGDPYARPGEFQDAAIYLREQTRREVTA